MIQIRTEHDIFSFSEAEKQLFSRGQNGVFAPMTVEEIAYIRAKYPSLYGDCLHAYTQINPFCTGIRICGSRKPSLHLLEDQDRLNRHEAQFRSLVEKYRNDPCPH